VNEPKIILDLTGYLAFMQEEELTPRTQMTYINAVAGYFEEFGELTKENVLAWKTELSKRCSASTVNLYLSAIRHYAKFQEKAIPVKSLKVQRINSVENVISDDDYRYLMDMLFDEERQWYYNILILAKTGARISEAVRLRKRDFMKGYARFESKGKVRKIIIPSCLKRELESYLYYLKPEDFVIRAKSAKWSGLEPMQTASFYNALQRFAKRYGIAPEVMHPHSFRHHFAIKVYESTGNISFVSDMLGHSSINTTAIYTRMSSNQQQKMLDSALNW